MADFTMITDRLATGAAVSSPDDVAALAAAGVTHVIDCRAEFDDGPLLAGAFTYLWNPTDDDGALKPAAWWEASLAFALGLYGVLGGCLYAHCAAGVNRGPSTAYAVLRACMGFSPAGARSLIVSVRPQVGLGYAGQFDVYWAARLSPSPPTG